MNNANETFNEMMDAADEALHQAERAAKLSRKISRNGPDFGRADQLAQAAYAACRAYECFLAEMKMKEKEVDAHGDHLYFAFNFAGEIDDAE